MPILHRILSPQAFASHSLSKFPMHSHQGQSRDGMAFVRPFAKHNPDSNSDCQDSPATAYTEDVYLIWYAPPDVAGLAVIEAQPYQNGEYYYKLFGRP